MKLLDTINDEAIQLLNNNKLLLPLIRREFVRATVEKVDIEKEEEENLIKNLLEQYGINDTNAKEEWMNKNDLDSESLKNLALADVRLKKYCDDNFKQKVNSRFLERKSQLDIYTYSLIRVNDLNKAHEIYMQISEKEADIGDLASIYSEGPEKNTRGIVGPLSLDKAHPILAEKIKVSEVGVVQPPIKVGESHIVCRVEYYNPAKLDENMHHRMALEIFEEWVLTKVKEISEKLLNRSSNKITN